MVLGCIWVFSAAASAQVGGSLGAAGQSGPGAIGSQPGAGLNNSTPLTPPPPAVPNPPMTAPQQPGIASQSGPGPGNGVNPTPGSVQPGQAPPGQAPLGTSCSSELSNTPGFLCPEPGTLPGSSNPPATIPPPQNTAPFQGMQNSPTTPGAPGTAPGQSGSVFGPGGAPIDIGPSQVEGGSMNPLTGGNP